MKHTAGLIRGEIAALEWTRWRMNDVPLAYTVLLPDSADAAVLMREELRIRQLFAADMERFLHRPWFDVGATPLSVDFDPSRRPELPAIVEEGLPPIRLGHGVDPFDGEFKPFADFQEVLTARAAYRASPLHQLRREREELWSLVDDNGAFADPEKQRRFTEVQSEIVKLEEGARR